MMRESRLFLVEENTDPRWSIFRHKESRVLRNPTDKGIRVPVQFRRRSIQSLIQFWLAEILDAALITTLETRQCQSCQIAMCASTAVKEVVGQHPFTGQTFRSAGGLVNNPEPAEFGED